jgi:uncharacterized protein YdiU (UPF0061 family)
MFISFDNTYARLPEYFFAHVAPGRVREPHIVKVNHPLAQLLGIDPALLDSPEGAALLSGNIVPEGAASIALAYAGHQFGGFVPQLGDGRAILLGEVVGTDGKRRDIQLKGSGRTPFSRGGDGRAALGPVLREYIVSEAMFALGIPTTRALAAVTTGEPVVREQRLPGAVLTRVAASHLRVGTFQFFAARDDQQALGKLTSYALTRHYSDVASAGGYSENEALRLLQCVRDAQAKLIARWLGVGFVHGVMNTDNSSISGETIDYGPCAFLDEYNASKTFSSIDRGGRYAFGNQPRIGQWNLARLAETLLPLISRDEERAVALASECVDQFSGVFEVEYECVMRAKLGLQQPEEQDSALAADLLTRLEASSVDYTVFFRKLCAAAEDPSADAEIAALFEQPDAFHAWAVTWRARLARDASASSPATSPAERARLMRLVNPAIIARNHRVEQAIAAGLRGDFEPFEVLTRALERPFEDQPEFQYLATPPLREERVQQTFCGT